MNAKLKPKIIQTNAKKSDDDFLQDLQKELERIRIEAELFFSHQRKAFPYTEISEFYKKLRQVTSTPSKNQKRRFLVKTLCNRFFQLKDYWERILKEKEAGLYYRDVARQKFKSRMDDYLSSLNSRETRLSKIFDHLYHRYRELSEKAHLSQEDFISKVREIYETTKRTNPDKRVRISLVKNYNSVSFKVTLL
ncbi:MAG: hypothetical protein NZO16_05305 [Deltaproteobacteria bacterium]|nr:hypothetical protein [Deltaproteobacteria bacterium]